MDRKINYRSMVTGLAALTGAGLYLLDDGGAIQLDEAVVGAALLLVVGSAGLLRSVHGLLSRRSPG